MLHYGPVLQYFTGVTIFVMIIIEALVLAICGHVAKSHVLYYIEH